MVLKMPNFNNKGIYTENTILTHNLWCSTRAVLYLPFITSEYNTRSSSTGGEANKDSQKEEEIMDEKKLVCGLADFGRV